MKVDTATYGITAIHISVCECVLVCLCVLVQISNFRSKADSNKTSVTLCKLLTHLFDVSFSDHFGRCLKVLMNIKKEIIGKTKRE